MVSSKSSSVQAPEIIFVLHFFKEKILGINKLIKVIAGKEIEVSSRKKDTD